MVVRPAPLVPLVAGAVGGVAGALCALALAGGRVPDDPLASPGPPAPTARLAPADLVALQDASARFDAATEALRGAIARLDQARTAPAPAQPADARRAGALIDWLPPEGVPLVTRWYRQVLEEQIARFEDMAREPRRHLKRVEDEAELQQAVDGWQGRVDLWRRQLAELAAVRTELELAKWLSTTGYGRHQRPEPWQLAEFALGIRADG